MQLSVAIALALAASVSALSKNIEEFKDNIAKIVKDNAVDAEIKAVVLDGENLKKSGASDIVAIFKLLNTDDYKGQLQHILALYAHFMDKVNSSDLYNYVAGNEEYLAEALEIFAARKDLKNIVQIPNANYNTLIKDHGAQFFKLLEENDLFKRMPSNFFSAVAKLDEDVQKEYCELIKARSIAALNKDNIRGLSSVCFSSVEGVDTIDNADFVKLVPSLNKSIFSCYNGALSEKVLEKITSEQLSNFGTRLANQETICKLLELSKVSDKAIKGVKTNCLASYLLAGGADAPRALGKKWKNIPATIFENINEEDFTIKVLAKSFAPEDKQYMSADLLNNLYKDKRMAKHMTPSNKRLSSKIVLSADIVAKTKDPRVFAQAIATTGELEENFLAGLDATYFENISIQHSENTKYEGLEILNLMKASNKAAVIKKLSAAIDDSAKHACSTIDSLEKFRKVKVLFDNASDECLAAVEFGIDISDVKKYPKLATGRTGMFEMFADDELLAKLTLPIMTGLSKSDFCAEASLEKMRKINKNALPGITGDCIEKISFHLAEFTPEETTRFADSAFAKMSNDAWKIAKFDFTYVNDAQLSQLSADVKGADMVTSHLSVEALQALDKRIAFLVSKQVSSMPTTLLLALPMNIVTADALDNLSAKQITDIASKLKEMSAEQIEKIGSKQTDQKAVVDALLKEEKNLSGAALSALKARATSRSVSSAATLSASTALLAALTAAAYLF